MTKYKNISSLFLLISVFCCNAAFSMYEDDNFNQNIIVINDENSIKKYTEEYYLELLSNDRTQEQENELIDLIYNGVVLQQIIDLEQREIIDLDNKIKNDERYYGLLTAFKMNDVLTRCYPTILEKAKSNNVHCQNILGVMFLYGLGVMQSNITAYAWFQKAADKGYPQALHAIGFKYYAMGNYIKTYEYVKKSADKGYPVAQYWIAYMYQNAIGVENDCKKAFKWHEKAANQGYANASYDLARMYNNGIGVDIDKIKAHEWYEKAANSGYNPAKDKFNLRRWTADYLNVLGE
ncbi:MAG: tetratricopeptide repeat protein [Alphaproteobacteria bacterium]|nr:tetratricopeptide repeat protein [Alphaproteobacteria bacterium]